MLKINTEQAGKILKRIIKIAFLVAIPIIIILPFIIKGENNIIFYMSIIYPNSILMLGIMYQFVRLFSSLEKNNPFKKKTISFNYFLKYFYFSFKYFLKIYNTPFLLF